MKKIDNNMLPVSMPARIFSFTVVVLLLTLVFMGINSNYVKAGNYSPLSVGQGGIGVVDTGISSAYTNPGAVHFDNPGRFSFELSSGGHFWNNLLYNGFIEEDEKDSLLNRISGTGWAVNAGAQGGLAFRTGPWGDFDGSVLVQIGGQAESHFTAAPDLAEVILKGNETEQTIDMDDSAGGGGGFVNFGAGLSYDITEQIQAEFAPDENDDNETGGFDINQAGIGLNFKMLRGAIFNFSGDGEIEIGYDDEGEPEFSGTGEYEFKYHDPADQLASGLALGAGVYGRFDEKITAGVSINNLLGSASVDSGEFQRGYYDEEEDEFVTEEGEAEGFSYSLPLSFRAGGSYDVLDWLTVSTEASRLSYGDGVSGFQLAAGVENRYVSQLPVRIGMNYSTLKNNLALTAGAGINAGAWRLNAGFSDLTGLFNRSRGVDFALSTGFEF